MNRQDRAIFIIASRILAYPENKLSEDYEDIKACIQEEITSPEARAEMEQALVPLYNYSPEELKQLYVSIFDLKAKFGLYLTAHELGDSSKRGAALIKLQKIINVAGFEREDDELADYIPMLFEFLAVAPDSQDNKRLIRRLAVAIQRIKSNLPENNPYYKVFAVLMKYVLPEPTKQEIDKLEFDREEADLEELPYPIMYK